jgi:hypothetical protein
VDERVHVEAARSAAGIAFVTLPVLVAVHVEAAESCIGRKMTSPADDHVHVESELRVS